MDNKIGRQIVDEIRYLRDINKILNNVIEKKREQIKELIENIENIKLDMRKTYKDKI